MTRRATGVDRLASENEELRARVLVLEQQARSASTTLYSIGDGVLTTDAAGRIMQLNRVAEALTGWTEREAVGRDADEVFCILNERTRARVESSIRRVLREGQVIGLANHTILVARDGSERPIADSGAPIRGETGQMVGVVLVFRDQTNERETQRTLGENERRFRDAIQYLDEGYYSCTADGTLLEHNRAFNTILGLDAEQDLRGFKLPDFWQHPEDRKQYLSRLMSEGYVRSYLIHAKNGRGDSLVVMANAHLVRDDNNQPVRIEGTFLDFTDRRRVETSLEEARARFEEAQRLAHLGSWEWDAKADTISGSAELYRLLEVDASQLRTLADFVARIHTEDGLRVRAEIEDAFKQGRPIEVEFRVGSRSGDWRHIAARGRVLLSDQGQPCGIIGTCMDITERKSAEAKLRQYQETLEDRVREQTAELQRQNDSLKRLSFELETIMDGIPGLVFYKDTENRFIRLNKYMAEAHKRSKADMEGVSCFDVYPREMAQAYWDDDLAVVRSRTPKLNIDEPWDTETGQHWVSTSKIPYLNERNEVIGVIGVSIDVTERKRAEKQLEEQATLNRGLAELSEHLRGDQPTELLCRNILSFLCGWLTVPVGVLYLSDDAGTLTRIAGYAYKPKSGSSLSFRLGEGLVGQAAFGKKEYVLADVPPHYFAIESGLGESLPSRIHIRPVVHNDQVIAVIELGTLREFVPLQSRFLELAGATIAAALESAKARATQQKLLEETQRQSEEMLTQQEELQSANEELIEQSRRLKESEARLKAQQEELQISNEELEEKNDLLERQKRDVELTRREIAEKAEELSLASRYKSEFLANMSHELRTPLNSLLLLARSLADNKNGNLTDEQVESAQVIYAGGNDLLGLINEILDLSKIEAGRMDLRVETVPLADLAASARAMFQHVAEQKRISFYVVVEDNAPECIASERRRIEQVLKNLVANAIKFTEKGSVCVRIGRAKPGTRLRCGIDPSQALAVAIEDTGIGISPEHHKMIFEAFQQADGSTARKFGGTGLGLSIAKELTKRLGGEIQLVSKVGEGSTFTLYLPVDGPTADRDTPVTSTSPSPRAERPEHHGEQLLSIPDDRGKLVKSDRAILIVEDDLRFADILARGCREQGFKVLAAATGEAGLDLARRFVPQGVILDLKLPGMDGWRVLDSLKDDPATRHIPVHVMSVDEPTVKAMSKGAIGYAQKPVAPEQISAALRRLSETADRRTKRVLVVEDNTQTRKGIVELIADNQVVVDEAAGGGEAIEALRKNHYDCMILDLGLWDFDGDELLKRIEKDGQITVPPIIVYTARDLTWEEDLDLRSYSDSVIIKGVRSDERLLDEVSLFLHRVVADMPEKKRQVIRNLHDTDALLRGKTALLVDDDMRALFALTKILTDRGMKILKADNGKKALEVLDKGSDVDVVLMDIMMPVLDGYETMKQIRAQKRFGKMPIIALTAKAMKGDQERCIQAGANDYLPKPVDQDRLVSMLRVWLYR